MMEPIHKYFRLGTLSWMSFPTDRYDPVDAVRHIARDGDLDAVEITDYKDPEVKKQIRHILTQSHLSVAYGAQPVILGENLNPNSLDEPERRMAQERLLEAMEEQQVTVDGITYALPELFMVIATQNPVEQLGTYRLPEAQLDRFMMKISMGYPETPADEADIVRRMVDGEPLKKLSPVTTRDELMQIKDEVKAVAVHQDVMAYAVEITRNPRKSRYLSLGASPRAAIALVRAAKSRAYLEGRMYTTPEDIAALAPPVLLHRLILSSEARLEGKNEREMLQEAMRAAHVPVL